MTNVIYFNGKWMRQDDESEDLRNRLAEEQKKYKAILEARNKPSKEEMAARKELSDSCSLCLSKIQAVTQKVLEVLKKVALSVGGFVKKHPILFAGIVFLLGSIGGYMRFIWRIIDKLLCKFLFGIV